MNPLNDLLIRLGIKHEQLSNVRIDPFTGLGEKELFERMEQTLTEEMNIDKILEFLNSELERLMVEFAHNEESFEKDFLLKAQARCFTALKYYIESPKLAKDKLEAYLKKININK